MSKGNQSKGELSGQAGRSRFRQGGCKDATVGLYQEGGRELREKASCDNGKRRKGIRFKQEENKNHYIRQRQPDEK